MKLSPRILMAPTLVAAGLGAACSFVETIFGSGVEKTEERSVASFDEIAIAGPFDVRVEVGSEPFVQITGADNLLEYVVAEVDGGRLELEVASGFALDPVPSILVRLPVLEAVALAGSGAVRIDGVDSDDLTLSIAGSGDIEAVGVARSVSVSIAGSGDVRLFGLRSDTASVQIAGSGAVELDAVQELDVDIAGSGDVVYRGSPTVTRDIAGSGSVRADG